MHRHCACTIVANNYLPFARVFARSFLAHHPEGRVWVLIVDRPAASIDYAAEPFDVVFVEDLGIRRFENVAFRYSILELNTAVKPYLLEHLHRTSGCERICYFDPDILVTGDLSPIYETLDDAEMVLTPHILEPLDDDGHPTERDFLLSGIYNLGFLGISIRPTTLSFLAWWQSRLYHHCLHRTDRGLFVDQRWMDFAPAFLDTVRILRDPGYNVAYWNLPHRTVESGPEGSRVAGAPLRFFHFSGIVVDDARNISKFQDRYRVAERPDVEALFRDYRLALLDEGFAEMQALPYAFGHFEDGSPVPRAARQLLQKIDPDGERWPDPFRSSDPHGYHRWLLESVHTDGGLELPRLAVALWDLRADVQAAFPFPLAHDAEPFARWFVDEVRRTSDLDPSLADRVDRSLAESRTEPSTTSGRHPHDPFPHLVSRARSEGARLTPDQSTWWSSSADLERGARPRIPRVAMMILERRPDLSSSFPDPLGRSRRAFALWFVTYGRLEYDLPASVVRRVLWTLTPRRQVWARLWWLRHGVIARRRRGRAVPPPAAAAVPELPVPDVRPAEPGREGDGLGVNVIGWLRSRTGVGEVCRGTLRALAETNLPYGHSGLRHPALDQGGPLVEKEGMALEPRYGVTLYHVNADMMPQVHRQLPRVLTSSEKCAIGYWFWELSHFPLEYAGSFRLVDEVWAPSRFCERAFNGLSPVEVRWVPPAVLAPEPALLDRAPLGIPDDDFVFFFAFDALSIPERKNPLGLLETFAQVARHAPRPTRLLLKISHAEAKSDYLREIRRLARNLPVTLLETSLEREELLGLFVLADAYVSLHRSEGLGLPLIEAMYLGRPVIATGYGGCTDFLDESTGWPIAHELETLDRSYGPYPRGAVWAAPDPEHAARLMLEVLDDPAATATRTAAARERVENLYSPRAAGARLRSELERIHCGIKG